jgi:hypothetical protein
MIKALEGRERYVDEVQRFSQKHAKHGQIPLIADLLAAITTMLSSCREKLKPYEWRQLLPRINGEASAVCEGVDIILESIKPESRTQMAPLRDLQQLHQDLVCLSRQARTAQQQVFATYLKCSDGLPLTSVSHVEESVVQVLRDGLFNLKQTMPTLSDKLHLLIAPCRMAYSSGSAAVNWRNNYDEMRTEIAETHAAINKCIMNIDDAESFLRQRLDGHAHSSASRLRSLSPHPTKRLKLD